MNDGKAQSAMRQWRAMKREQPLVSDEDGRVDNPLAIAAGFPAEVSVRPLRLHTTQVEDGGLGGHCFSADFARYLAKVKPTLTEREERQVRYWWASDYGQRRVLRQFLSAFGGEKGKIAFQAAVALSSEYADYPAVMAETGYSVYKLSKFVSLARRFASQPSPTAR